MLAYEVMNDVFEMIYSIMWIGMRTEEDRDNLFQADSCEANPTNGNNVVRATKS